MATAHLSNLPVSSAVRSLVWSGDRLIDWAAGRATYGLDGSVRPSSVNYAYPFDAAAASPSGRFTVLYQRLGTKGLVLDDGQIVREIDRSFYHAAAYEYPVAPFALPDGREVIAHCPHRYNRIEIDELASGRRLTDRPDDRGTDFFHSRLAASAGGTRLLSAGWVWHPFDAVAVYDVAAAIADPARLDDGADSPVADCGVNAAAFMDDDRLLVVSEADADDFTDGDEADGGVYDEAGLARLRPGHLAVYDLRAGRYVSVVPVAEPIGTLMPLDATRAVSFYDHPKLVDLSSGRVLARWPALSTGRQTSGIIHHLAPLPPLALDPVHRRFAVAGDGSITVVQLD